jgi:hypothetical protein
MAGVAQAAPVAVMSTTVSGPRIPIMVTWFDRVTLNGTAQILSDAVTVTSYSLNSSIWVKCASPTGTASYAIGWLESPNAESTDFTSLSGNAGFTSNDPKRAAVTSANQAYERLQITGTGSNPSDTVCTAKSFFTPSPLNMLSPVQ